MGMIPQAEIRRKAGDAFSGIIKAATEWRPTEKSIVSKSPYPAERFRLRGTTGDVNRLFYGNGWSLGLPIVPPTPGLVAEMLNGTSRKPDEVIGTVPPRDALLTVELAAIHAVMAGAKPEYLPVIIAAMEAILDPAHGWRAATTTTNPVAPLLLINGPVVKELGIQYSTGALGGGPFSQPNVTIGYTINLIGDIVGGSKPPSPDQSTLGQTANIVAMVVGENEEANPWEPFHVEKGYGRNRSTVTVFGVRSFANNNLHDVKTAEDLLTVIADVMMAVGAEGETTKPCAPGNKELLLLSPEHTALIKTAGWSKKEVQKFLFEKSKIPRAKMNLRYTANPEKVATLIGCMKGWENWDAIPYVLKPEDIAVVVAGGPGKHSVYMSTNGYTPVTREIKR
jgi:hypothetical protein